MEPRRVERGPGPGVGAPMTGRPVNEPLRPAGGMRAGEGNNRAPMGGMPHNAVAAPRPMGAPGNTGPAPGSDAGPSFSSRHTKKMK